MKLVLLGTAGLIPTDQAQTACFLLPEVGVLLDAGTGLYRLSRYLQTDQLDIYLSHEHGDHTSGLIYLFASFLTHQIRCAEEAVDEESIGGMVVAANMQLHSARIHATQPALDFLTKEYEPYEMDWRLLHDQEPLPYGGTITSFDLGHNSEVGFRLDWPGHSLAYVTDTTARLDAPYLEAIRGVDVLLHDGYGPDHLQKLIARTGHSTVSAVAQLAAAAQVGRLILVHRNPIEAWSIDSDVLAARSIFSGIEIGQDGMEIDF